MQGDQFAAAQTGAQRDQEQRVIRVAAFLSRVEELIGLGRGQRLRLSLRLDRLGALDQASRWIVVDQFVFDGMTENAA